MWTLIVWVLTIAPAIAWIGYFMYELAREVRRIARGGEVYAARPRRRRSMLPWLPGRY